MKITSYAVARPQYYDRNAVSTFFSGGGTYAQHATTTRWTTTVAAGKKMLNAISSSLLKSLEQEIIDIWTPVYESKDAQEGPLAFSEKRKPQWKNC